MNNATTNARSKLLLLFVVLVVIVVAMALWLNRRERAPSETADFPLPAYTESRFLNTSPQAKYVGIKVCAECHHAKHNSYLQTAHSRAFADLDPKEEPPDGSFYHKLSGHSFRVYRKDGQFRHEEVLRSETGSEIARLDLPIRYLVGSGYVTRSYLVEVDGFLHESPITWYTARKSWDMSPGYNQAGHWSFERPVDIGCLKCHTGRAEPAGGGFNRVTLHEKAIGCESCHGPGSLHVDFHRARKTQIGEDDLTIVNPGKLARERLESICAQCHLRGDATILVRGRKDGDFRPGKPLTDYQVDYHFASLRNTMKVVGHVEQMRLSRCYQKSDTLTCTTCHNPHARSKPKDPAAFYRNKCLSCHTPQSCGLEQSQRLKKNASDNCLACHMPRGDTDIPHIAFTHHRIGVHRAQFQPTEDTLPELLPVEDVSCFPLIDQKRNLGLAYVEVFHKQKNPAARDACRARGLELLQGVYDKGLRDGDTMEALARLYWDVDANRSAAFAKQALEQKELSPSFRVNALLIAADYDFQNGQIESAIATLKQLVRLRRHSEDWRLLGLCHLKSNRPNEALKALLYSSSVNPFRAEIHGILAETYQQIGDGTHAKEHRDKAEFLSRQLRK